MENLRSFCSGSVAWAERLWRRRRLWRLVVRSAEFVLNESVGQANQHSKARLAGWLAGWLACWLAATRVTTEPSSYRTRTRCASATLPHAHCCCRPFRLVFSHFQLRCGKPPGWDRNGRSHKPNPMLLHTTLPVRNSRLGALAASWTILVAATNKQRHRDLVCFNSAWLAEFCWDCFGSVMSPCSFHNADNCDWRLTVSNRWPSDCLDTF